MKERDNEFFKRLLSTFKAEAADHLKVVSSNLLELEKTTDLARQKEIVEVVFREVHSLKGAARAVNNAGIERICQSLENVFSALKKQEVGFFSGLLDLLLRAVGKLEELLAALESERSQAEKAEIETVTRMLDGSLRDAAGITAQQIPAVKPAVRKEVAETTPTDTVRVATSKLDALLLQSEEMLSAKQTLAQRTTDLREIATDMNAWKKEWRKIQGDVQILHHAVEKTGQKNGQQLIGTQLKKILEFLERDNTFFRSVEGKLGTVTKAAVHDQRSVALMVDNLLDDAKKAVMFPFTSLVEMFPKFVRELSRDQGKDAELEIHGAEIEIDRRILEEIKNPLVHLVRNCVDHGLEHQRERKQNKKQARGTIRISIAPKNGNKVEIAVSDDGRGINAGKVRSAAVKNGLLSQDEAAKLTDQEAYFLIFQSGVSTSPMITDVSGRGLGLAIVREKVEKLGGTISFETSFNVGTAFRIVLPLTLATVRGLLVRSNEHIVILPTASIERTLMLKKNEIRTVEDRETIQLDGEVVGLAKLADVLELSPSRPVQNSSDTVYAVVLNAAGKRLAFTVDEVLHEQEVLTKSLGSQLSRVRNVASATVLGTGRVVPVLNVPDLIKSAVRATAGVKGETPAAKEEGKKQSVLVVEDSITARSLLKNILETAGYRVSTAVDGIDAYTQLRTGEFDIVVSDVDMPRMNGFDLTAKIRGDKKLSEMPVILVTALESREDRERGIDVGANAYIIKSSFDQSNLLEAMRRLV